jgi:hypothetical protein
VSERRRLRGLTLLAVVAGCLALAPAAGAAVTFGDSLGVPFSTIVPFACGRPCTLSTTTSPYRLAYFRAPISGMIFHWSIQMGPSPAQRVRFRVLRRLPGEQFLGAGTSAAVELPTAAGTYTFATRLPVAVGDFIGLNVEGGPISAVAVEEESIRVFEPPLVDFGAAKPGAHADDALLVNAQVAAPPTSQIVSSCSKTGVFLVRVSVDDDPEVAPRALHVRIGHGRWRTVPMHGHSGIAQVSVPAGKHTLDYWAEDSLGQREAVHHLASVLAGGSRCQAPSAGADFRAPSPRALASKPPWLAAAAW